jgi:hypothetical protein
MFKWFKRKNKKTMTSYKTLFKAILINKYGFIKEIDTNVITPSITYPCREKYKGNTWRNNEEISCHDRLEYIVFKLTDVQNHKFVYTEEEKQ